MSLIWNLNWARLRVFLNMFSGSELKTLSDLYIYRGVFVTVSTGARYMVGSCMT